MDQDITLLLRGWRQGDTDARDRLIERVYGELRDMAGARWYRSGGGQTLQPTALLNEAVLRLCGSGVDWRDRAHFFALAALKMRAVLVDHARARQADKRGGMEPALTLSHADREAGQAAEFDVIALDMALQRLAVRDPRAAQGLEMAYFGGMEIDEIACVLEVSPSTVDRDLRVAKAWLRKELA